MSTNSQSNSGENPTGRPLSVVCCPKPHLSTYSLTTSVTNVNILKQQTSASQDSPDLVKLVDDLLDDISSRFATVSTELFTKSACFKTPFLINCSTKHTDNTVDDMATRLDSLEASILARDMQDDGNHTPKK